MTAPKKRKVSRFTGLKVLLATLSIAGVLGFWNLFSVKALNDDKLAGELEVEAPSDPPPGYDLGLPPLPTLVALESAPVLTVQTNAGMQAPQGGSLPLRQVAAPTPSVVQKQKPVVVEMGGAGAAPSDDDGGGGGGGSRRSSARTHSS